MPQLDSGETDLRRQLKLSSSRKIFNHIENFLLIVILVRNQIVLSSQNFTVIFVGQLPKEQNNPIFSKDVALRAVTRAKNFSSHELLMLF